MITGTFLTCTSWVADVDRDVALALGIARVGDQLAAAGEAAGVVDVAERHLDRLGAGLAVFAGRPGQLHHHADGHVAVGECRAAR